jgi:hypothetical protein
LQTKKRLAKKKEMGPGGNSTNNICLTLKKKEK